MHVRPSSAYLVLAAGIMISSTAAILFKIAEREGLEVIAIAAGRLTIASLVLSPIVALQARQEIRQISRRDLGLAIFSGVMLALHFASWFASLAYTSVASSAALVTTLPIFVGLASVVVLSERLPRPVIVGIGVAVVGSILIGLSDGGAGAVGSNPLLGDLLAIGGAIAAAAYLLAGQIVRRNVGLLPYIWLTYSTAAVVLLGWAWITGVGSGPWTSAGALAVLGLALGPQLLGHTSFNWAVKHISATFVSVASLGEPIGSTLLAFFILDQVPQPLQLLGGAILLAGIYTTTRGSQEPAPSAQP